MNVKQWISQAKDDEREAVAKKARTSVAYLWQLAGGHRRPSPGLADRLEKATQEVTPERVISRVQVVFGRNEPEKAHDAA